MKKKIFIATIQIAFEADNEATACDAVSAMFSENLKCSGAIIDWQYEPHNGRYISPSLLGEMEGPFEEGELFIPKTTNQYE